MSRTFQEPTPAEVQSLLQDMVGCRIAVIGDGMLDTYILGEVARISPEAPVPVMNVADEQLMLGGAANVAKALAALGARTRLCCIVGDDADAEHFKNEATNIGIGTQGVITDPARPTTRKTRIVARNQQVIRLDYEDGAAIAGTLEKKMIAQVEKAAQWADGVIISDYAKGALTDRVCRAAIRAAKGKPVIVDPKRLPWTRYRNATVIKPNTREAVDFVGFKIDDDAAAKKGAKQIAGELGVANVLITRSNKGMSLYSSGRTASAEKSTGKQTPARFTHFDTRLRDLIDVTGAGDVVAGTLALAMAAGAGVEAAAWLANVAAGVKVGKFGAATVTGQEIIESLDHGKADFERKVMTRKEAGAFAARLRKQGKQVVFTNGCFDLLHVGHVNYLERSRRCGDALIVGINTDASVRRLKGEGRPVQHEADRAHILASLAFVDAVVLFDEDTPIDLIKAVKPDVLTKGKDYKTKKNVVGWDIVEANGGRVELVDLVAGRSTTKLIDKAAKP